MWTKLSSPVGSSPTPSVKQIVEEYMTRTKEEIQELLNGLRETLGEQQGVAGIAWAGDRFILYLADDTVEVPDQYNGIPIETEISGYVEAQNETAEENPPILSTKVEKINTHLNIHWKNRECPICESTGWELLELALLPTFKSNQIWVTSGYPMTGVACKECGYVLIFAAIRTGHWTPEEEKNDTDNRPSNSKSEGNKGGTGPSRDRTETVCSGWRMFWSKIWNVIRRPRGG